MSDTTFQRPARRRAVARGGLTAALVVGWALVGRGRDDGPLSLGDLAAYREAMEAARPGEPAPKSAGFRDLWDRPAEYQGRRVAIGGRVERVFHQGAVGQFPALAEVWVIDPTTDPLCLVFPESADNPAPRPGDRVRFEGTFLRKIRYRGGDVDRLAPLIVGAGPPSVEAPAPSAPPASRSPFEWVLVAVLLGIVVLALLRAHLRRPIARPIVDAPPPEFQDGHRHDYDGDDGIDDAGRD